MAKSQEPAVKKSPSIRDQLREQSKEELLSLLDEILADYPGIFQTLAW